MSIAISTIVDNGNGTATLSWTGADVGTISVFVATAPYSSWTTVNTGGGASGSVTFNANAGINFAYMTDVNGLTVHYAPMTEFTMGGSASAFGYTLTDGRSGSLMQKVAAEVRYLAVDFTDSLGTGETIATVSATATGITISNVYALAATATINGATVNSLQSILATVSGGTAGHVYTVVFTATTSKGQTITGTIMVEVT